MVFEALAIRMISAGRSPAALAVSMVIFSPVNPSLEKLFPKQGVTALNLSPDTVN
jgi:hypothetical protein